MLIPIHINTLSIAIHKTIPKTENTIYYFSIKMKEAFRMYSFTEGQGRHIALTARYAYKVLVGNI